ncbi:uncharacterized protein LOC116176970 [Photinus pyralis]|uniref:uncharacterized protein LOC116176970 n=1 Tax=Photinus pyralis TaxID=7054 RepID=UPI0012675EA2|nr:uncharacterized protein LOC116176970 [Photinus pyralis]
MKIWKPLTLNYLQMLMLVECSIPFNLKESQLSTKVCIHKTINHLFAKDDTLSLIPNNRLCDTTIFEMELKRPFITLNIKNMDNIQLHYEGQFVICAQDGFDLFRSVIILRDVAESRGRGIGNANILIIMNTVHVSFLFERLWLYGVNNLIILAHAEGKMKLYMSNRYSSANTCGAATKVIISEDCEDQIKFAFTKEIRQMNNCPLTFTYQKGTVYTRAERYPYVLYVLYFIQELSNHVNATFKHYAYQDFNEGYRLLKSTTHISVTWTNSILLWRYMITGPIMTCDIVWLVPMAVPTSTMNVFLLVVTYDLWIAIVIVFICVSLTWCLIVSYSQGFSFNTLCYAFLSVWSLTISGNVSQMPRSFALRITFLCYLIYVIHVQCGLTSNMATVLTKPRIGFQIRNLEQLADSQLPIYIFKYFGKKHFPFRSTGSKLYMQLEKELRGVDETGLAYSVKDVSDHRNCAVITTKEDLHEIEREMSYKSGAYKIWDNSMTGAAATRFVLIADHYFTPTLNSFVSTMFESGIGNKRKLDFYKQYPKRTEVEDIEDGELTLRHITFAFVILGCGLGISCLVFCCEHFYNKF